MQRVACSVLSTVKPNRAFGRKDFQTKSDWSKQEKLTGFVIGQDTSCKKEMFIQYLRGFSFLYRVSLLVQVSFLQIVTDISADTCIL